MINPSKSNQQHDNNSINPSFYLWFFLKKKSTQRIYIYSNFSFINPTQLDPYLWYRLPQFIFLYLNARKTISFSFYLQNFNHIITLKLIKATELIWYFFLVTITTTRIKLKSLRILTKLFTAKLTLMIQYDTFMILWVFIFNIY